MERREVDARKKRADSDTRLLKLALWVIGIAVAGVIICVVLAAVRWALEACLIVGGILVIIALIAMVAYNRVKYRIKENQYNRLKNEENRQSDNKPDAVDKD